MICNNNYLADILRVCKIKDLIWVMRFQSPLVYHVFENIMENGAFALGINAPFSIIFSKEFKT